PRDTPSFPTRRSSDLHFARLLMNAGNHEPWRLQLLTDLGQLPDYDEGYYWGHSDRGAPVDADGNPVFYHTPKSYKDAKSDGERRSEEHTSEFQSLTNL